VQQECARPLEFAEPIWPLTPGAGVRPNAHNFFMVKRSASHGPTFAG
jgi:hypothetical protein